jgi:transposase
VAASSKLHRPAGDRVKTDARDALHLARLLRLNEVVPVRIPTQAEEAAGIWCAPVRLAGRI